MAGRDYPMLSVEEAWQQVAAHVHVLPPVARGLTDMLGRVLAQDVSAIEPMPPFPAAAMDGFAVIAADTSPTRRIVGEQPAGRVRSLTVQRGTAVRVMTGAPLPQGADAVVRLEDAEERDGMVSLRVPVQPGQNLRHVGEDLMAGEVVLTKGLLLGPAEIGLLATLDRPHILVHPKPTVAVMATGDELVPPGQSTVPGQIRDSNSYALLAAVEAAGGKPMHVGLIPDNRTLLREAMLEAVSRANLVLATGGLSGGSHDYMKPLLEEMGTVHFGQVALRPGRPLTFATIKSVPVFGLPGSPVSTLVSFEMFVRPAMRLMGGHAKLWRPEVPARLTHDIQHLPDRTEFQRAVVTERDGAFWAETTGPQMSGRLKSLVGANAFLRLPAGIAEFRAGETVTAILVKRHEDH